MITTEKIWNDFQEQLLGFIKSRINDVNIADDILQDVFIKIHQMSDQLKDEKKLASWVYQITRNSIIDYYRKKKLVLTNEITLKDNDNKEANLNPQFINCLFPFLKQLPDKYKEALEKTAYGELSQKEYALELGISYSAVKSRVQRARTMLKDLFTSCCSLEYDSYGNIIYSNIDDCSC